MLWAHPRGAVHSKEAVMEVWRQHGLAWCCDPPDWQVVEQKYVPRTDWCRNPAQGVGFLVLPRTPGRPANLLFDTESSFPKESSVPSIETADATSDDRAAVPALPRAMV